MPYASFSSLQSTFFIAQTSSIQPAQHYKFSIPFIHSCRHDIALNTRITRTACKRFSELEHTFEVFLQLSTIRTSHYLWLPHLSLAVSSPGWCRWWWSVAILRSTLYLKISWHGLSPFRSATFTPSIHHRIATNFQPVEQRGFLDELVMQSYGHCQIGRYQLSSAAVLAIKQKKLNCKSSSFHLGK